MNRKKKTCKKCTTFRSADARKYCYADEYITNIIDLLIHKLQIRLLKVKEVHWQRSGVVYRISLFNLPFTGICPLCVTTIMDKRLILLEIK